MNTKYKKVLIHECVLMIPLDNKKIMLNLEKKLSCKLFVFNSYYN